MNRLAHRFLRAVPVFVMAFTFTNPLQAQEIEGDGSEPDLGLTELYTVGALDGADWENFSRVSSVAFDHDGNLLVLDGDRGRVAVVAPSGELLREWGRLGDGPGEFGRPLSLAVLSDGTIAVVDVRKRAYLHFEGDGEYIEQYRIEGGGMSSFGRLYPHPSEPVAFEGGGGVIAMSFSAGADPTAPTTRPVYRVAPADGMRRDVFYDAWKAPADAGGDGPAVSVGGGVSLSLGSLGPKVWEPRLWVGALPDGGLAVIDSSAYAIRMIAPNGRVRTTLRRSEFTPRMVTEGLIEEEKERRFEALANGESRTTFSFGGGAAPMSDAQMEELQRQQIEDLRFYHEVPAIARMAVSPMGTLWVRRYTDDATEDGPIDLVRMNGQLIGTLPGDAARIPSAFGPDGLVAYIEEDDFDVPYVAVRRLAEGVR